MKCNKVFSSLAALLVFAGMIFAQGNERVYVVRTSMPFRETLSQSIKKTGSLISPAEVLISAKVAGRLVSLESDDGKSVDTGVFVKKGGKIATIDNRDYKAQHSAALANVDAQMATVNDTKREFERLDSLFKSGTIAEQARDQAEANFQRAEANLSQAMAQEEAARINLDECTIYAPMDGVVSVKMVEPGTLLSQGTGILKITRVDSLRFRIALPTTLFSAVKVGKTSLSVEVDAYPGEVVSAVVTRVFPVADEVTRTVLVDATIANEDGRYVPGMYAVGTIDLNKRENVLCVPFDCVIKNDKERIVYRVEDGIAKAIRVKLGIRKDSVVEVLEGLSEKDEIVVAGQHRLTDGVMVKNEVL